MTKNKLKLGAILIGVGAGSEVDLWRDPQVPLDASVNLNWYVRQTREAEDAKFDFVFIVDSQYITPEFPNHHLNRLEPLTLLSAVATQTSRIGLVATISTTYSEPFDIARRLASLDLISDGRAGWNIVTSSDPGTASNFSGSKHGDYADRYGRATESVAVVQGLWNSYEDGAFAQDRDAPRFFADPSKLHRLDHDGQHFKVRGPLNLQRSRQGQPPLVQAGTSDEGRDLSARAADLVFSFARTQAESLELIEDIRARAAEYGRDPSEILFVPALGVTLADTVEEAQRIEDERSGYHAPEAQLNMLSRQFGGHDFSGYDLDERFPEVTPPDGVAGISSFHAAFVKAREDGKTLRDVLRTLRTAWFRVAGTPQTVADEILRWYESGAADGFNYFVQHPGDWARFRKEVIPLLVERGAFRDEYEATTLRGNLGLRIPENLHTVAARTAESKARGEQNSALAVEGKVLIPG